MGVPEYRRESEKKGTFDTGPGRDTPLHLFFLVAHTGTWPYLTLSRGHL
jgi:hypothetical protein